MVATPGKVQGVGKIANAAVDREEASPKAAADKYFRIKALKATSGFNDALL